MDPNIDDTEELANFILESNKFTFDGISWRAMLPQGDERSLFRISDLPDASIQELGEREVAKPREKPLLGWGKMVALKIRAVSPLKLRSDEPPPRHAVVVGWPSARQEQKALALVLASEATKVELPK